MGAEGDAGRAREIIEEWTSKTAPAWSRPAELAGWLRTTGRRGPAELELEPEEVLDEEPEEELEDESEEDDTPLASDVRFGWFSPIFLLAAACVVEVPLWAAYDWMTICKYPAAAEGGAHDQGYSH